MASVDALSIIVRSLARCTEERREAVGLLLDISDILKVRQRIGRIKGSILMLVALQNGDDPRAKDDAGKLLHALSANTQNVLLMAEAGCFVPMMHHLREGNAIFYAAYWTLACVISWSSNHVITFLSKDIATRHFPCQKHMF